MFRYLIVILIAILSSLSYPDSVFCKDNNDSLLIELQQTKNDVHKVQILTRLCYYNIENNLGEAIKFGKQGLKIAYKLKSYKYVSVLCSLLGDCYNNLGNTKKSLEFYKTALYIYKAIGDKTNYAQTFNNIAVLYSSSGDYVKALENLMKALSIYNETSNNIEIADCYNNMGAIYQYQKNLMKALEFYNKSLNIYESINENNKTALLNNNIGIIYFELGETEKAFKHLEVSLKISEENNYKFGIANAYMSIGDFYKNANEYDNALDYFQKSLAMFKEIDNNIYLFYNLNYISEIYVLRNDYSNALIYGEKAYAIFEKVKFLEQQKDFYFNMSAIYEGLGNYDKALNFHKLYAQTKDSILNKESQNKIIEMEAKYESEKKEKEIIDKNAKITLLEKNQVIEAYKRWGLILLIIVSFVFVLALRKRIIANKQLYEQKVKNFETQKLLSDAELYNQKLKSMQLQQELEFKQKELNYKNNELVNFALHISEKNDFLKKLKSQLSSPNENYDPKKLSELININLKNLERDRQEFDANVENVSHAFFMKLREIIPDITKNEERLSVLLRLNLSSKEIAAIMNITLRGVEMARFRLRKKLNLNTEANLNEFLKAL